MKLKPIQLIHQFLQLESASGIILFIMAIVAMLWANSPYNYIYDHFIERFIFLINDGLMTIFFLVVGLELKRAFIAGQLSKFSQIALPAVAAIGGMLVPAIIYIAFNYYHPSTLKGWAIPVATDIAFALGALSLLGHRIPVGLKLFLMALAIFDDIGAIVVIALFYSKGIVFLWLFQAAALILILWLFNLLAIRTLIPYLLIGAWLWLCLLKTGIHPVIGGFVLALTIPGGNRHAYSPLHHLEQLLHPLAAYVIMPLFALANAGVNLHDVSFNSLAHPVLFGIIFGLFIGKQIGVFGLSWSFIKLGYAELPDKATWSALYGVSMLCGIGFTMSLFLGTLAFAQEKIYLNDVRIGVIVGSLLSGLAGTIVLFTRSTRKRSHVN